MEIPVKLNPLGLAGGGMAFVSFFLPWYYDSNLFECLSNAIAVQPYNRMALAIAICVFALLIAGVVGSVLHPIGGVLTLAAGVFFLVVQHIIPPAANSYQPYFGEYVAVLGGILTMTGVLVPKSLRIRIGGEAKTPK